MTPTDAEALLRATIPKGSILTVIRGGRTRRQAERLRVCVGDPLLDISDALGTWLELPPVGHGLRLPPDRTPEELIRVVALTLFADPTALTLRYL